MNCSTLERWDVTFLDEGSLFVECCVPFWVTVFLVRLLKPCVGYRFLSCGLMFVYEMPHPLLRVVVPLYDAASRLAGSQHLMGLSLFNLALVWRNFFFHHLESSPVM